MGLHGGEPRGAPGVGGGPLGDVAELAQGGERGLARASAGMADHQLAHGVVAVAGGVHRKMFTPRGAGSRDGGAVLSDYFSRA